MSDKNKKEVKLSISFTDEVGETTSLEKIYNEEADYDIGKLSWLVEEFKYFLKAMSFPEFMTDRVIVLENGDKVIDRDGNEYDLSDLKE